jgi:hypothetical protein
MQLAEQAASWAGRISRFFTQPDWKPGDAGIHLRTGKGDAKLEYVVTKSCGIWLGKGNVTMDHGCIADLKAYAGHGDVKCESILPQGEWAVKTGHGNIRLSLPADTQAKLDIATRHGDIRSEIPLVRVGRPGPESRYGGRMVGTVGNLDSSRDSRPGYKPAEIDLATMNGDIRIGLLRSESPYTTATTASASTGNEVNRVENENERPIDTKVETPQQTYDSPLNVLQALSHGEITVEEAERVLKSFQP